MASSGSLLVFCTAQMQDIFGAYDQSYTFAQGGTFFIGALPPLVTGLLISYLRYKMLLI